MYFWYIAVVLSGLLMGLPAFGATSDNPLLANISKSRTGDFSAMKKNKVVRVLIPYSLTSYYIDKGKEKGVAVEYMRKFEAYLNKKIKKEIEKVRIVFVPTQRDLLIPALVEGRGDLIVASLTITPERQNEVDFSQPVLSDVREVVITKKGAPAIDSLTDLSKREIHVRKSSSYYNSLLRINEKLKSQGKALININLADENLEDEDLLAMVDLGVIPAIIVDEFAAKPWLSVYGNLKIHDKFAVSDGGKIGWAFRKNSPELQKVVNLFVAEHRVGTVFGNIMLKRYFSKADKIVNPKTEKYRKKLKELLVLFNKYGKKYNIDPILIAAQAFQESRFNNNAKSRVGAVGIMQILPSTARDKNVNIKNFRKLENNIEAGTKYMRFIADQYFKDDKISELNKILFVFASYNAGPNRIARVRKLAVDSTKWFDSVDWQVSQAVGDEPIKYVKNIYIYYVIFKNIVERRK